MAGYDLLNEPLPDWFSQYNDQMMPFYKEMTTSIREVDTRHMIILEGVHWATDWSIFTEKIDDNLMLQFHKYWSNPDTESIFPYLEKSVEWNVPIFMGEGGENSKEWYSGAFQLFEDHGISWNFWPWKKLDTRNSPCSIHMPSDWQLLVRYLEGENPPNPACAERILWEYLDNLPLEPCTFHEDIVRSLFRRAPFRVPAVFYGYKGEGVSFGTASGGHSGSHPEFRERDCTDIRYEDSGDGLKQEFWHGKGKSAKRAFVQLAAGDWLAYDFTIGVRPVEKRPRAFAIRMKLCPVQEKTRVTVAVNSESIGSVEVTGEEGVWQEVYLETSSLQKPGRIHVVVKAEINPVRIEWIEI